MLAIQGWSPATSLQPWREAFLLMKHQRVGVLKSWCLIQYTAAHSVHMEYRIGEAGRHCHESTTGHILCTATEPHSHTDGPTYPFRTTANINELLKPIEETIRHWLIQTTTGKRNINDLERKLYLPCLCLACQNGRARLWHLTSLLTKYMSHSEPSASPRKM